MGYGLVPYSVPLDVLCRAFGSKDRALLAAVEASQGEAMAEHDEYFEDEIEEGAPPIAAVLAEIVDGRVERPEHAFQYAYALEQLCQHLGDVLDNAMLSRTRTRFLEAIDRALKKQRVAFSVTSLVQGSPPIPIPTPDDFPGVATFDPAASRAALALLRKVDASKLDQEVAEAIAEITGWFEAVVSTPGRGLVCFYY